MEILSFWSRVLQAPRHKITKKKLASKPFSPNIPLLKLYSAAAAIFVFWKT
jgi:hypothetical protein